MPFLPSHKTNVKRIMLCYSWNILPALPHKGKGLKEYRSHMSVFTYKDQPVDPWVVPPELRRLIQLVQLVDPLQHHLVGFTWKSHYALKTHTHTHTS